MNAIPMRISCRIEQPIVYSGDGLHIDGLIAYGFFTSLPKEEQEARPPVAEAPDMPLPLEREEVAGEWVWKASAVFAEWQGRTQVEVRRMTATDQMLRWSEDAVVNISSGQFKGMDLRHEAYWPKGALLTWYAVGDIDRVRELLGSITAIGRVRNHGHGKITDDGWAVIEDENARQLWKRRNMPSENGTPTPIRPPYWCWQQFRKGTRVR